MANMNGDISVESLQSLCGAAFKGLVCEYVLNTDSTNTDLLERIDSLKMPTLRVAKSQMGGRGRLGRRWESGQDAGLCFSLACPFSLSLVQISGVTLVVGVALAEALIALGVDVQLKWPNDLLRFGKKMGGILVESGQNLRQGKIWLVIGVGINLSPSDEIEDILGHSVGFAMELVDLDRSILIARIIRGLCEALQRFEAEGLSPFVARWNALHAYVHEEVSIIDQGKILQVGRAIGIDRSGRLLLENNDGTVAILVGDVSLRLR